MKPKHDFRYHLIKILETLVLVWFVVIVGTIFTLITFSGTSRHQHENRIERLEKLLR